MIRTKEWPKDPKMSFISKRKLCRLACKEWEGMFNGECWENMQVTLYLRDKYQFKSRFSSAPGEETLKALQASRLLFPYQVQNGGAVGAEVLTKLPWDSAHQIPAWGTSCCNHGSGSPGVGGGRFFASVYNVMMLEFCRVQMQALRGGGGLHLDFRGCTESIGSTGVGVTTRSSWEKVLLGVLGAVAGNRYCRYHAKIHMNKGKVTEQTKGMPGPEAS